MIERCRSCREYIVWRNHERTGKPAPIEVKESDKGNVYVNPDGTYGIGDGAYLNHFASCEQADSWRRKA